MSQERDYDAMFRESQLSKFPKENASQEKIAAMNLMAKQQETQQKGELDAQKMYMDAEREQQKAGLELETKTKLANIEIVKKLADLDIQKQKAALDAEAQQRKILASSQKAPE